MSPARTPDSRFGRVLRANVERLLKERGSTSSALCEAMGIDRANYSRIFKTPKGPTLATLERIANSLGVTIEDLVQPPLGERIGDGQKKRKPA